MSQVTTRPAKDAILENWQQLLHDPTLNDLPYKIETNARGQLILSPVTRRHTLLQYWIAKHLEEHLKGGYAFQELSILTLDGVRVADVAWASQERNDAQVEDVFTTAPEICVEVWSPSNTPEEFERKRELYLQAGASEFWTCDHDGHVQFFDASGEIEQSVLVAEFPKNVMGKNK
jgi:Uma2 family endonuclease